MGDLLRPVTQKSSKADEDTWLGWLTNRFPGYVKAPFAQRHVDLWDWVWAIRSGIRPRPFVAVWPRGGAKSTSAELACTLLGEEKRRRYALYTSNTQEQADKHVASISTLLESDGVERALNKYGSSKGWRRNRLYTADGFTVDAIGLDTAARGFKIEDARPDLIILDDIDDRHDSRDTTNKKRETITQSILPSGANDLAVLAIQNLVHHNSLFMHLSNGTADWLLDRIVSGPFKAVDNAKIRVSRDPLTDELLVTIDGQATWAGQDIATCINNIKTWGLRAFEREAQHKVGDAPGALWSHDLIDAQRVSSAPPLNRIVVAIDPASTSKSKSDDTGIGVSGRDDRRHGYALADYTCHATPNVWASRACAAYLIHEADCIVGEGNNGGDMVGTVVKGVTTESIMRELVLLGHDAELATKLTTLANGERVTGSLIPYHMVWASRGKEIRAEPVSNVYAEGRGHHVGTSLTDLEDEMCTWVPGQGHSPNRIDWLVWTFTELGLVAQGVFFG